MGLEIEVIEGEGRNIGTCTPYARREGFTPLTKTPKEILAIDNVNFPPHPPMVGTPEKRNMNNGLRKIGSSGKRHQARRPKEQGISQRKREGYQHVPRYQLMDCPLVVDALIEGFRVRRIHVDGGSSLEVMRSQLPLRGYRSGSHYGRVQENPNSQNGICGGQESILISLLDDMEERRQLDKGKKPPKSSVKENIVVNDNYLEQLVTIRGGLSAKCRHVLIHTLRKNVDIFAWTPADMTGISRAVTEHILDTYPHIEPKVQKKRSLAPDKRKVVTNKVNEWLKAGIVCPKDLFHLPEIDWKIESLMGFQYKCFLDAYKGYHQIQMTKKDKDKTDFHMEEGVFCYTKMPFGLKNAGATYQRLVDSSFKEQIGVNLEAYVDDMVIKSRTEQDIVKDIDKPSPPSKG
ncbi:reverse transcriptase domain-containing protein [Tanacetum coccineum]